MGFYLGIDVGSVSTNLVVIDGNDNIIERLIHEDGRPAYKCIA